MDLPVIIQFMGLAPSQAVEAAIRQRITDIDRDCPDVSAWRVTVVQEGLQHQQERPCSVLVAASVPGQDLSVVRARDPDVHIAVRKALDAVKLELLDAARIRRSQVTRHEVLSRGHA